MAKFPTGTPISRDQLQDAPDWVDPLLQVLNPFMKDVSNAFQGGVSSENLREQYAQVQVNVAADPADTFTNFKVQIKNTLGVPPRSVQLVSVAPRFDTTLGVPSPSLEKLHLVATTGEPAFENSWVNYGGAFQPATFYMDPWGFTHIEGTVKDGGSGTTCFTLPIEYRPTYGTSLPISMSGAFGVMGILSTGEVQLTGTTTFAHINGIFRAGNRFGLAVGTPIWTYHNNGLIEIQYIPGLRPSTPYTLGFVIR